MRLSMPAFTLLVLVPLFAIAQPTEKATPARSTEYMEWIVNELVSSPATGIRITGKPLAVVGKYGKACLFNGSTDGIFLDQMPLQGLAKFTIEMIFCPYSGGSFEQRFFHCGEVKGSRVLLELRSTDSGWYFDAFVKSGLQQKTLIEPRLLHPLDQWCHIAFVVENGRQITYINGKKELESGIEFAPLLGGITSIGVRQNEQSWFKGAIYKIKISPAALSPDQFLKY